jgi:hypothetical protein
LSHLPTILFTAGLNYDTRTQVDSRMTALHSAIKSTGVTNFTGQIDTDGSSASACATDA